MKLLKISKDELTPALLIETLGDLRQNSLADNSHFAVSAIVEILLDDLSFAYVGGVNIEHSEHNRLTMHAEQSAIVSAVSLFGNNFKLLNVWVMGAPDSIIKGSKAPLADNFVKPCGHCRQILLSFATEKTAVFSVAVNGAVEAPLRLVDLLPQAFSERDLVIDEPVAKPEIKGSAHGLFAPPPRIQPWRYLSHHEELNDTNIRAIGAAITPHVIDLSFKTSPIQACIIKVIDSDAIHYFSGALVQDIAFLTTDAVFASIAAAITEFGGKKLNIQEINFYGESLEPSQLSGVELEHISRFSSADIKIKFHKADESSRIYSLIECIYAHSTKLVSQLISRNATDLSEPRPFGSRAL